MIWNLKYPVPERAWGLKILINRVLLLSPLAFLKQDKGEIFGSEWKLALNNDGKKTKIPPTPTTPHPPPPPPLPPPPPHWLFKKKHGFLKGLHENTSLIRLWNKKVKQICAGAEGRSLVTIGRFWLGC